MGACKTCGGRGWVEDKIDVYEGNRVRKQIVKIPCPNCGGSGNDGDDNGGDDDRGVVIIQHSALITVLQTPLRLNLPRRFSYFISSIKPVPLPEFF